MTVIEELISVMTANERNHRNQPLNHRNHRKFRHHHARMTLDGPGKVRYSDGEYFIARFCIPESKLAQVSLTDKQHIMLEFIERYVGTHRQSPLIREIQQECQIASYKSAIDRLNALERKGVIKRLPNKHRGIRILRKAAAVHLKTPQPAVERAGEGLSV